jgi:hypothetical protein
MIVKMKSSQRDRPRIDVRRKREAVNHSAAPPPGNRTGDD